MRKRGSVASRKSRVDGATVGATQQNHNSTNYNGTQHYGHGAAPSDPAAIYDASVVDGDSAEDLRAVIERQEREAGRLENVRACCDGELTISLFSAFFLPSPSRVA